MVAYTFVSVCTFFEHVQVEREEKACRCIASPRAVALTGGRIYITIQLDGVGAFLPRRLHQLLPILSSGRAITEMLLQEIFLKFGKNALDHLED